MRLYKLKFKFDRVSLTAIIRKIIAMAGLSINAVVCTIFFLLSRGKSTHFNYMYVSPFFCRLTLRLLNCNVNYPKKNDYPDRQVMYIFNHNSYLDILIIPSMRIPNCRYIISEVTKNVIPLLMCNISNGALFIPRQKDEARRLNFFKETTEKLKKEKMSIYTSPEGTHTFKHYIAPFNKGIFDMAMKAGIAICPVYFSMKKEHNPFESFTYKGGGSTRIDLLPLIETDDWTEDNLEEKVQMVRNKFVDHFNQDHGENIK